MKAQSILQFAIVDSDSASDFEDSINARVRELEPFKPTVTFSETHKYLARISYRITEMIPESAADEMELEGVTFRCEDCPAFSPILKEDGTEDKRVKYGDCEFSQYGRTPKDGRCCKQFWTMLRNGGIGLCWKKSE